MRRGTSALAMVALCSWVCVRGGEVRHVFGGRIEVVDASALFSPVVYLKGWTGQYEGNGPYDFTPVDGVSKFTLGNAATGVDLNGTVTARPDGQGNVNVRYELDSKVDRQYEDIALSCIHSFGEYLGGWLELDGKRMLLSPDMGKDSAIWSGTISRISLFDRNGTTRLALEFNHPQRLLVQDNRLWNENSFVIRYYFMSNCKSVAEGERFAMAFRILATGEPFTVSDSGSIILTVGSEWIPMTIPTDITSGSSLDFSAVRGSECPAGKYGRVVVRNGHFEFEGRPGVAQRFYGVNICESANVPNYEASKRLAARLRKMGYNAARIHHHENYILNILKPGDRGHFEFDDEKMRKFDYLVAALIENGIYLTTDLYVSRMPISYRSIGIDRAGNCDMQEFKELLMVHEGAVSNYLSFARAFLSHVNPFTGRSYALEPALSLISLVNEGNIGNCDMKYMSHHQEFADSWKAWLAEKQKHEPAAYDGISDCLPERMLGQDRTSTAYAVFIRELDERFAARVTAFLRNEMKCRALTTNLNNWSYPIGYQLSRAKSYDYVDDHFYVDQPTFLSRPWHQPSSCRNENPIAGSSMGALQLVSRRIAGKPFTISEYNYSGPGRFRGVGGIVCGALAALQDWSGLWRFDWCCDARNIEGAPLKVGYFDMCGDPLSMAAERAVICLFLRRDMSALQRSVALNLPSAPLRHPIEGNPNCDTRFPWLGWFARIGMTFDGDAIGEADIRLDGVRGLTTEAGKIRRLMQIPESAGAWTIAGDGTVRIEPQTGSFALDTPRTSGGFAERGRIDAGALTAEIGSVAATIWASSLDERPLSRSGRILVTHLTDVQNNRIRYADSARRILLEWGELPHIMRRGTATVTISTGEGPFKVYALTSDGSRRTIVPSHEKDGRLTFLADIARDSGDATYLYEIVRNGKSNLR